MSRLPNQAAKPDGAAVTVGVFCAWKEYLPLELDSKRPAPVEKILEEDRHSPHIEEPVCTRGN